MTDINVTFVIEGRVQGVWFRDSTRREAIALGINGWVKNRQDGSVEVMAEGPEDRIEKLIAWCKIGPPAAEVLRVIEKRGEFTGKFKSFTVEYY